MFNADPIHSQKMPDVMDPTDVVDFVVDLNPLLEDGENFDTIELFVMAESAALGFEIKDAPPYQPEESEPGKMRIWAGVTAGNRTNSVWDSGQECGIEFTAVTDSSPPRTFQRTVVITVKHL